MTNSEKKRGREIKSSSNSKRRLFSSPKTNNSKHKFLKYKSTNEIIPWINFQESNIDLKTEIHLFGHYISLSKIEITARNHTINCIRRVLKTMHENIDITPFGSFPSNLGSFMSDVDLRITGFDSFENQISQQEKHFLNFKFGSNLSLNSSHAFSLELLDSSKSIGHLENISKKLIQSQFFSRVEVIRARVPIIQLTHKNGIEIDISFGQSDTVEQCKFFARKFQNFANIVIILKLILAQNSLNKTFTGGLGSYYLYLLLVRIYLSHPNQSADLILLNFLDSYRKSLPLKATFQVENQQFQLAIPNTVQKKRIQSIFDHAYFSLQQYHAKSKLSQVIDVKQLLEFRNQKLQLIEKSKNSYSQGRTELFKSPKNYSVKSSQNHESFSQHTFRRKRLREGDSMGYFEIKQNLKRKY